VGPHLKLAKGIYAEKLMANWRGKRCPVMADGMPKVEKSVSFLLPTSYLCGLGYQCKCASSFRGVVTSIVSSLVPSEKAVVFIDHFLRERTIC